MKQSTFRAQAAIALGAGALAIASSVTSAQNITTPNTSQSTLSAAQPNGNATLRVDLNRLGAPISLSLYGVFFEEINHAGDGGIYAELVRNRSFEDADTPQGWQLITQGTARGDMTLDNAQPLNASHRRSLRLDVSDATNGRVAVANEGYWGIPVRQGKTYQLSLHARRDNTFNGALRVSLESVDGRVLAQSQLTGLAPSWKKFQTVLKATDSEAAARLVITPLGRGTVWLDVVSLFPETWKNRPNGLRPDLAAKVADLQPSFVRFPGGCFVEGHTLDQAFDWKETVLPLEARPGRPNLWGYRSTDGLGYHEYLQMTEDVGAEALFVVNCGMSHTEVAPIGETQRFIQDALDAIEYANGPVTSQWGKLRAERGHPKPFNLRYIQVGNENGGPAYNERYALFYDALKKKHPEIRVIANLWNGRPNSRPIEILDEHYYHSPQWFLQNANRYDSYDRTGPKIYVGEYAVTQGAGTGNLISGLAEAAFMTGMERNADIVTMASYAPLFVHVNDRKWNPDAIVFDNTRSYGTPSYHVQKLFAQHRPNVNLPTQLTVPQEATAARGGIGLGTWLTAAEYRNVRVTQGTKVLLEDNFSAGPNKWRTLRGDWKVQDGAFRQSSTAENMRATTGDASWGDYTLEVQARKISGQEGFMVMFHTLDDNNYYWWNLGGWMNQRHGVEKSVGGSKTIIGNEVAGSIETGRWYNIKIEVEGSRIRCYLDGKLIHDIQDRGAAPLHAVAGRAANGDVVLKVINAGGKAQTTEITLAGARRIAPQATAIVMQGKGPNEENTLDQPTRIAPVTSMVNGLSAKTRHVFPPYSLTIWRLKADV